MIGNNGGPNFTVGYRGYPIDELKEMTPGNWRSELLPPHVWDNSLIPPALALLDFGLAKGYLFWLCNTFRYIVPLWE